MNRKTASVMLLIIGILTWIFPRWNGIFSQADTSSDVGKIISAVFIVGAIILRFSGKDK